LFRFKTLQEEGPRKFDQIVHIQRLRVSNGNDRASQSIEQNNRRGIYKKKRTI